MINLLQNKLESLDWTAPAFKCDQKNKNKNKKKKKERKKERDAWKVQCSVEVHSGLRDSTTCPDLYVSGLLRFDIVKSNICIAFFLLVL